jgi:hypothetical protein
VERDERSRRLAATALTQLARMLIASSAPLVRFPTNGRNGSTASALYRTMPDRDWLTCERWLLRCELAEIREQAVEHRRRTAWWREEVRAAGEETAQAIAQSQKLMEAGRRAGSRSQPSGR